MDEGGSVHIAMNDTATGALEDKAAKSAKVSEKGTAVSITPIGGVVKSEMNDDQLKQIKADTKIH